MGTIKILESTLEQAHASQRKTKAATGISAAVGNFGGLIALCGVLLAPLTGGVSLVATLGGTGVALAGTGTSIGFEAAKIARAKVLQKEVEDAMKVYNDQEKLTKEAMDQIDKEVQEAIAQFKRSHGNVEPTDYEVSVMTILSLTGNSLGGAWKISNMVGNIQEAMRPVLQGALVTSNTFKHAWAVFKGLLQQPAVASVNLVLNTAWGHASLIIWAVNFGDPHELEKPIEQILEELKKRSESIKKVIDVAENFNMKFHSSS